MENDAATRRISRYLSRVSSLDPTGSGVEKSGTSGFAHEPGRIFDHTYQKSVTECANRGGLRADHTGHPTTEPTTIIKTPPLRNLSETTRSPCVQNQRMRIRMDEEREDRLRRLMQATGESTKAGAIDTAIKHYLTDLQNKRRVAESLSTESLEELHTPYLPLERETNVGRED